MEANNLLEEACGWIASCLTLTFFVLSILPILNLIFGKVAFEDVPGLCLTISYVNSLCWYIYGDFLYSDQIKFTYLVGTIINFVSVFIYLYYESKRDKKDAILNGLIILLGTYTIYVGLTFIVDNVDIIEKVCFGTYSLLYLFPIYTIYNVIKTKNYKFISFYSALGSFVASSCWAIYGFGIVENYVIYPHVIIIILASIQMIIYQNYSNRYPHIDKRSESSTIGIEKEEIKKDENIRNIDEETQPSINEKPVKIVEKIDD